MRVVPPLSVKRLNLLEAGELFRMGPGAGVWCIAATVPERDARVLIALDPGAVRYRLIHDNALALSYGRDYVFRVSRDSRMVTGQTVDFEKGGAMLIEGDRALIRIPSPSASMPTLYYDIATGAAGAGESPGTQMAILDWSIALAGAKESEPPLYDFHAI